MRRAVVGGWRGATLAVVAGLLVLVAGCPEKNAAPTPSAPPAAESPPPAAPAPGGPGFVRQNKTEMPVWGAVAVWNPANHLLRFVLVPFAPTAETAESCRTNFYFSELKKLGTPDASKWKDWCPFAALDIFNVDETKDSQKLETGLTFYLWDVAKKDESLSASGYPGGATIEGKLAEGSTVHLVARTKDPVKVGTAGALGEYALDLQAKVVLAK